MIPNIPFKFKFKQPNGSLSDLTWLACLDFAARVLGIYKDTSLLVQGNKCYCDNLLGGLVLLSLLELIFTFAAWPVGLRW